MPSFDLATLTRRAKNPRRRVITLRPITPPALQATALYTSVYAPVIAIWSASLENITAAYAQSLSELQTDAPADVTARIEAASSSVSGVIVSLRFAIGRWSESVEAWHRRRWTANVLTATNVSLDNLIGPQDVRQTVASVIEQNVSLVRSVSDQTKQRIANVVFQGFRERKPANKVAAELQEVIAMSRRRAKNIASDQLTSLGAELNQERRRQAGIDSFEWVSSGKPDFRPEHKARNGNLYSESQERVGQKYQGKTVKKPPPPSDRAGVPINCGCTERAVLLLD